MTHYHLLTFPQIYSIVLAKVNANFSPFGLVTLTIFFLLILITLRLNRTKPQKNIANPTLNKVVAPSPIFSAKDIKAIAGDNEMTTQLDLARAYLEMEQHKTAKKLLQTVMQKGNVEQQHEAKSLLAQFKLASA